MEKQIAISQINPHELKVHVNDKIVDRHIIDNAGIIGFMELVSEVFDQIKHLLESKEERKFTPVGWVEGVYSMKRLGV